MNSVDWPSYIDLLVFSPVVHGLFLILHKLSPSSCSKAEPRLHPAGYWAA
uniref:Uncharacterized protein n=1 Tax=Anguilla anguilla TaxID=7936 RepID=A0A0E9Q530_ANGAN